MPEFRIANYLVSQTLERFTLPPTPTETRRDRALVLESEPLYHNVVITARLHFSTYFDGWNGSSVVGYAQGFDTFTPSINGWYPLADYATVYDLFRNERPLYLAYERENEAQAASYVTRLTVRSDRVALALTVLGTAGLATGFRSPEPPPVRMLVGPASGLLPTEILEEAMRSHAAETTPARPEQQRDKI